MIQEEVWRSGFQLRFDFQRVKARLRSLIRSLCSFLQGKAGRTLPAKPERVNVLFIGQDALWHQVLKEALKSQGDVYWTTLQEANAALKQKRFTLIVVDTMGLSEGDISSTVRRLQKLQPQSYIVFASASPTWKSARETLKAGASDYTAKSYDPLHTAASLRPYLQPRTKTKRRRKCRE